MLGFAVFAPSLALASLLAVGPPAVADDEVLIAAVLYTGSGQAPVERACRGDSACAIDSLVRMAAKQGAKLIVTPEYGFDQVEAEPDPALGTVVRSSSRAPLLTRFGALANELDVYLVIDLQTQAGGRRYNTQVAFDPKGVIVAKHHKFELFGAEKERLTAGTDVSAFETPFGTVGLLICADIYGPPRLHERLVSELGVDVIAMSSMWTVPTATRWQAAFAHDWEVFVVAANRSAGDARGGGVFDPHGRALASSEAAQSEVVLAPIPTPRRAN